MFWAALIGVCGAFTGVAFRAAVRLVQRLLTGSSAGLVETAELLPWWARIAVPTVGGVCAGTAAVGRSSGCCARRDAWTTWKPWPSAMASSAAAPRCCRRPPRSSRIGSGGSIGREGPLVQLAATVASKIGQWTQAPIPRLRLLVACGAAAGIAAAYNAPIAGALFVAEVVLGSIAMESFGPLIVSSVVSDATSAPLPGLWAGVPGAAYQLRRVLGAGAVWVARCAAGTWGPAVPGAARTRAQRSSAACAGRCRSTLALGGLVVGVISVAVPQVWGNGYSVVNDILNDKLALNLLALVLVAKLVSTAASVGSGANGGILTPTLFMGAAFGALFADILHLIDPHLTSQQAAYAVVGMGAFLAATTHAPLTSILLIFEMTLDYEVVLPLMLACVTGHYVARIYRRGESVYTRALRATGEEDEWRLRQIAALTRPPGAVLQRDERLAGVLERLAPRGDYWVYVVDSQNQLVGQVDCPRPAAPGARRAGRSSHDGRCDHATGAPGADPRNAARGCARCLHRAPLQAAAGGIGPLEPGAARRGAAARPAAGTAGSHRGTPRAPRAGGASPRRTPSSRRRAGSRRCRPACAPARRSARRLPAAGCSRSRRRRAR